MLSEQFHGQQGELFPLPPPPPIHNSYFPPPVRSNQKPEEYQNNPSKLPVVPDSYYHQTYAEQLHFPGMDVDPEDFVRSRVSGHPHIANVRAGLGIGEEDEHWIRFEHPDGEGSSISWHTHGGTEYRPGEITMIRTSPRHGGKGLATLLMDTAKDVALHYGVESPRHSANRSKAGVAWSNAYEARRGNIRALPTVEPEPPKPA